MQVRWRSDLWFIDDKNGRRLFSFDLPQELFRLYARAGDFSRLDVAEMKRQVMSDFFAYHLDANGTLRIIQFELVQEWYSEVRARLGLPPVGM